MNKTLLIYLQAGYSPYIYYHSLLKEFRERGHPSRYITYTDSQLVIDRNFDHFYQSLHLLHCRDENRTLMFAATILGFMRVRMHQTHC